jgi:bifunctional DNA-binding transcriptional regulator/antitoxin component of YhaV-PrlF toxin-antitoxin module
VKLKKIVGLPAIVSSRNRIVIDKGLRKLYGIQENDTVRMRRDKNLLFINPADEIRSLEVKEISIGRFNLPMDWAIENHIKIGDCVYLVATTNGIIVCPKGTDFMCLGEVLPK